MKAENLKVGLKVQVKRTGETGRVELVYREWGVPSASVALDGSAAGVTFVFFHDELRRAR